MRTLFPRFKVFAIALAMSVVMAASVLAPQPAHAIGAMSNYLQNKVIDWLLRGQSFTAPTTVYVALSTSTSTAASCGTEVSGGSYARVAVTSSLANWAGTQGAGTTAVSSGTTGLTSNNTVIQFPAPSATWGSITGLCVFDASTGGDLLLYAPLTTAKTVNSGDAAPSFTSSAFTYQLQ